MALVAGNFFISAGAEPAPEAMSAVASASASTQEGAITVALRTEVCIGYPVSGLIV